MGMDLFKNIVVGVNISDQNRIVSDNAPSTASCLALECAERLAIRNGAKLHVLADLEVALHAQEMIQRDHDAGRENVLSLAEETVERIAQGLRDKGIDVTSKVAFGHPGDALLADAEENGRDLIVVGTRERSAVSRNVLGSTSLRLLRKSKPSVWVARQSPHEEWDTVFCPVDFGDVSKRLVQVASACAKIMDAKLILAHVVDYSGERVMASADTVSPEILAAYRKERHDAAQERLDALARDNVDEGVNVEQRLLDGRPSDAILETAAEVEADLVVMGSVSHSALSGILFGSTAENVLPHLETSLLVMKPDSFDWS